MAHKLFSLLAVTSLAILACSYGVEPVNALSGSHQKRDHLRGHDSLAKRKRNTTPRTIKRTVNGRRCQVRPGSESSSTDFSSSSSTDSSSPSSTPAPAPTTSSTFVAPSSTSSTSAAPSATSSSSGAPAGKGCLAWPNGDQSYLGDYHTDVTNLLYSWSETGPSNAAEAGFTFVPQLWGWKNADAFQSTVVGGYSDYALFLNEPDESSQSNIDPTTAASMWTTYMEPLRSQGYTVGSAATTSAPEGLTWMQDFFTACNGGCNVDFMALHWYGTDAGDFITYVENWYNTFQKPIWVTEFADMDYSGTGVVATLPEIQAFMSNVTGWMDAQDYVQYYCWFGAMLNLQGVNPLNSLMNSDGSPSSLGEQFIWSG